MAKAFQSLVQISISIFIIVPKIHLLESVNLEDGDGAEEEVGQDGGGG